MALGAHESKKKLTLNTSDLDELDWSSTCKTFSHDFEDKIDTLNTSKLDVLDLSCNDAEGFNDFIRGSTSTPKRIQDNSPATSKLEFLDDVDNDDDVASSHQAPKQSFGHATTQYSNQNTGTFFSLLHSVVYIYFLDINFVELIITFFTQCTNKKNEF